MRAPQPRRGLAGRAGIESSSSTRTHFKTWLTGERCIISMNHRQGFITHHSGEDNKNDR